MEETCTNRMNPQWFLAMLFAMAVAFIPAGMAQVEDINHAEIYWVTRKAEALHYAKNVAYRPNPEVVTRKLNEHINSMMNETMAIEDGFDELDAMEEYSNSTRRVLGEKKKKRKHNKYRGPCKVTNPIDRERCPAHSVAVSQFRTSRQMMAELAHRSVIDDLSCSGLCR